MWIDFIVAMAFQTNVMPVVGAQFQWDDVADSTQVDALALFIEQHDLVPSRCDIILRGGAAGDYTLVAGQPAVTFRGDDDSTRTISEIEQMISAGASFTVTAVPPGSGLRLGIDWDRDCIPNQLDNHPLHKEGDVNDDSMTNFLDLDILIGNWALTDARQEQGDLDGDGVITFSDINILLGAWADECAGAGQTLIDN